jgi:DNA helicase-2/ATP-dependent DNA helicase PcrA
MKRREIAIIGPPGTGKTTHLISIVKVLTEKEPTWEDRKRAEAILGDVESLQGMYRIDEILYLVFSTADEKDVYERITGQKADSTRNERVGMRNQIRTSHSLAQTILLSNNSEGEGYLNDKKAVINMLRKYKKRPFKYFALQNGLEYDETDYQNTLGNLAEQAYSEAINTLSEKDLEMLKLNLDDVQRYKEALKRAILPKVKKIAGEIYWYSPSKQKRLVWAVEHYIDWKATNETVDFDEIILRVYLRGYTLKDARKTKNVKVLIIDEAQDFGELILKMIRQLIKESDIELVIFAGDPLQSIYSFQGASLDAFLNAIKDAEKRVLEESRRLTKDIRNLALSVIPIEVLRTLGAYGITYTFKAREGNSEIKIIDSRGYDVSALVSELVPKILDAAERDKRVFVLTRTNRDAYKVAEGLVKYGIIPLSLKRRGGLYEKSLSVLQALEKIKNGEPLSEKEAETFLHATIFGTAIYHAKGSTKKARQTIFELAKKILMGQADPDAPNYGIKGHLGVLPLPHDFKDVFELSRARAPVPSLLMSGSLRSLLKKLTVAPEDLIDFYIVGIHHGRKVADFLEDVIYGGKKLLSGAIYVDTIHAAKGLEADVVVLLNPIHLKAYIPYTGEKERIEEELRLLFVGITRAREHLIIYMNDWSLGGRALFRGYLPSDPHHGGRMLETSPVF